mgnify:CR=1 FL=1
MYKKTVLNKLTRRDFYLSYAAFSIVATNRLKHFKLGKFVRLICFAQWKRERFAISFRVTAFDLDPKTGFRFPPVQAPFREELSELYSYIEQLVLVEKL